MWYLLLQTSYHHFVFHHYHHHHIIFVMIVGNAANIKISIYCLIYYYDFPTFNIVCNVGLVIQLVKMLNERLFLVRPVTRSELLSQNIKYQLNKSRVKCNEHHKIPRNQFFCYLVIYIVMYRYYICTYRCIYYVCVQ